MNLTNENVQLKTKLQQKKKIIVYVDNQEYFIDHSTAYALGLVDTRAIMLDKPKLVNININLLNKIKNNSTIEIEYVKIVKKSKIMVYVSDNQYCIDNSAAYALGLITTEEFYNLENPYFYINEKLLQELNVKYDVQMCALSLSDSFKKISK